MSSLNPYIVSSCRGRLRLRASSLKETERIQGLEEALKELPGVNSFFLNSRTGSLLIEYSPGAFNRKAFERIFLPYMTESMVNPTIAGKAEKVLKSKTMRRIENRGMLVFSALTVASVFMRTWKLHTWAGVGYIALSALHSYRYRKTLLK